MASERRKFTLVNVNTHLNGGQVVMQRTTSTTQLLSVPPSLNQCSSPETQIPGFKETREQKTFSPPREQNFHRQKRNAVPSNDNNNKNENVDDQEPQQQHHQQQQLIFAPNVELCPECRWWHLWEFTARVLSTKHRAAQSNLKFNLSRLCLAYVLAFFFTGPISNKATTVNWLDRFFCCFSISPTTKQTEKSIRPTKHGIAKLLTSGFDEEQIWQQLQTYHKPLFDDLSAELDEICGENDDDDENSSEGIQLLQPHIEEEEEENDDDEDDEDDENDDDEMEDNDGNVDERALRRMMSNEMDDDDDDDDEQEEDEEDDEQEENVNSSDYQPEQDINKFISQMEDDLDVLDEQEFDEDDSEEHKRALKALYGDGDLSDDDDDEDDEEDNRPKTMFQRHQEQLLETIEKMENENMKEKDWQKKGETTAKERPVNSLLEEDLVFDHQAKVKPIITEEVTRDLESIILSRIVSGIFDDPEKPDLEDRKENARNAINLQSEKSKKSLAEIYEDMYLKKVEGKDVDVDLSQSDPRIAQERNKIRRMMANTLYSLNKLSSFNYVPPPIAEFETVEDGSKVKPIDAKTTKAMEEEKLAPHEIIKPVRELPTANVERTEQEKKRKRREVKEQQAKKSKKAKELVDMINPAAAGDRKKNDQLLKQLKEKNVKKSKEVDPNATNYSSSKRFFELMQEKSSQFSDSKDKDKKKKKKDGNQVSGSEATKMRL